MILRAFLCIAGIALAAGPSRGESLAERIAKAKADSSKVVRPPTVRQDPSTATGASAQAPTAAAPTVSPAPQDAVPSSDPRVSSPKDTSAIKQLPPRTLPFKEQMMFAGGFMIFLALMITSMQNFNPND